jgi:hypothetical protein
VQQPQPLGRDLSRQKIDAGRITARSGNAGDQTKLDGVFADREDDRYCCGRSFGRKRGRIAPERNDYRHATAGQVGHERWQAIVLALQPMVLDRRVLALDVAGFVEPFLERSDLAHRGVRRPAADEADDRQRRLLRARRERRRCRRAANERHKLATPHSITSSARASSVGGISSPSAFAVLRLIASWYFVGCCTGRSAGLSPLRMRSTYEAARWYRSIASGP